MDYKYYERKINDIIMKCPIEAGVEILVYNVLDNIVESKGLSLVDINRLWKDRDPRLTTGAGIPDIAILSSDFQYKTDIGQVLGFIEVKATSKSLSETEQIEEQKSATNHYIYTNGLVWKYYENHELEWEVFLEESKLNLMGNAKTVSISENSFTDLLARLNNIIWI
ncbi:hypothetical protein IMSAG249_01905 [Lachnospiraceae bacterium]|jgi:hypothetical protein|nr:hypothetical protein IMSAGC009_04427 [Lachnospiraceae bacterium]GFI70078.1 hypothetical protein IMSAG249_01905 [Lachnospiraceae bacterium]